MKHTERVRGEGGRYVSEKSEQEKSDGAGAGRTGGTVNAKRVMQKKVKQAWPEITDMLVKTARDGDFAVTKWLWDESGLGKEEPKKKAKKRHGFAEAFMAEWRRHQAAAGTEAGATTETSN